MKKNRNRQQGWQYAKVTGHINEYLVAKLIEDDEDVQKRILDCCNYSNRKVIQVLTEAISQKGIPSILGGVTKSKTDITLLLDNGDSINISLKKDRGGQVFLVTPSRFISGFEKHYNVTIPSDVKRAINLFWGSAEDTLAIIDKYSSSKSIKEYEIRKHRLTLETLLAYDKKLADCLIEWFSMNSKNIFDFCFSKGLAIDEKDWADVIWYKNTIKEDEENIDCLINIKDFIQKASFEDCSYGNKNGGTTIWLPFGFVQWHNPGKKIPGEMQFHHNYEKILLMIEEYMN